MTTRYVAEDEGHEAQLKAALNRKKDQSNHFHLDIQPYNYQKEVLEQLHAERTLYGRTRNLIVAATGVGKTVISAFDYKDSGQAMREPSYFLSPIGKRF